MTTDTQSVIDALDALIAYIHRDKWPNYCQPALDNVCVQLDGHAKSLQPVTTDTRSVIAFLDALTVEIFRHEIPELDDVVGRIDDLIDALKTEEQAQAVDLELWGWINDL